MQNNAKMQMHSLSACSLSLHYNLKKQKTKNKETDTSKSSEATLYYFKKVIIVHHCPHGGSGAP